MTIEGYAALFGVADLCGDVIRAGAFRACLARMGNRVPMLFEHEVRNVCGFWRANEDGRGLFVSGSLDEGLPGAAMARRAIGRGVDGLSIGFRTRRSHVADKSRVLIEIDLLEASIVAHPMQPLARLGQARAMDRAI
jgi:HK97 family phage prohead protease